MIAFRRTNRSQTFAGIMASMRYLEDHEEEFGKPGEFRTLPLERKFGLATQFYNCQRANWQMAKIMFDVGFHFVPLFVAIWALLRTMGRG